MIIYKSGDGLHVLRCVHKGKRKNAYKMYIGGWYAGGFSAGTHIEAFATFKRIAAAEGVAFK